MTIKIERIVEHEYEGGDQSALHIGTITFGDGSASLYIADDNENSIMVHSPDQLKRLIRNLQYVADNMAASIDSNWEKPE